MRNTFFTSTALVFVVALILAPHLVCAAGHQHGQPQKTLIKEQPHAIYHVIQNKNLEDALKQIANRSGIAFNIYPELKADIINCKLAGNDWSEVLTELLKNYNYSSVSADGIIKKVIVSGRNGTGVATNSVNSQSTEDPLTVEPDDRIDLPERYKSFHSGSVMGIKLPMAALHKVVLGGKITLELPIGHYEVRHDNLVKHEDGSSTWMGYLENEGQGYRVYLSEGETGILGNITTPDGNYAIDSIDNRVVLVDINRSGLQEGSFEGDLVAALADTQVAENQENLSPALTHLKQQIDQARMVLETAQKQLAASEKPYVQAKNTVRTNQVVIDRLKTTIEVDIDALVIAKAAKQKQAIARLKTTIKSETARLKKLIAVNKTAKKKVKKISKAYSIASHARAVREAQQKLDLAQSAFDKQLEIEKSGAKSSSSLVVTAIPVDETQSADTVIDLMVLYSTESQTADYAKQRIGYLTDITNQSYKDSGVNLSVRLVHTRSVGAVSDGGQTNSKIKDIDEALGNDKALSILANDKNVKVLRQQYGADLVMLFKPYYAATASSCGVAYVMTTSGSSSNGYSVVNEGYSKDSVKTTYCSTLTFPHEIGHNLGNVHDREYSSFPGAYSYSYAWGIDKKFGTIMSYKGPRLALYSTPNLPTQCAGGPCGFAEDDSLSSDQVRSMSLIAPKTASFYPAKMNTADIQ